MRLIYVLMRMQLVLLVIFLVSCSSDLINIKDNEQMNNVIIEKKKSDDISIERYLTSYTSQPAFLFYFSNESFYEEPDELLKDKSRLVEDIACVQKGFINNFVLVVDNKDTLVDSNFNRAKIFHVSTYADAELYIDANKVVSWGAYDENNYDENNNLNNKNLGGPKGCEIFEFNSNYVYSLISDHCYDDGTEYICAKLFRHFYDGQFVVNTEWVETFTYFLNSVDGVSLALFNDFPYDYLAFICDPIASKVRVFKHNDSSYGTFITNLDLSPDFPIDVTVMKRTDRLIYVFVAVSSSSDRHNDRIHCFLGTKIGPTWQWTDCGALRIISSSDLCYINNVSVHEFNDYPNNQLTVLLKDTLDGYGVRMFQLEILFYSNPIAGVETFNYKPDVSPLIGNGLGVGKAYNNRFLYFIGDKDPGFTHLGNNGDGENIFVYRNSV